MLTLSVFFPLVEDGRGPVVDEGGAEVRLQGTVTAVRRGVRKGTAAVRRNTDRHMWSNMQPRPLASVLRSDVVSRAQLASNK